MKKFHQFQQLNTITETNKYTHKIWTGPSGVKQYAQKLHKHYPNTKAGTEHVYVHTDHPAEHVAHTLKHKLGLSGFAPGHGWSTQENRVQHNPKKVTEMQKMSRQHDDPESAERHRASLEKSGVKAWVNKTPDNKHNVFWQVKEGEQVAEAKKKPKKFDKMAHIRSIARNVVGQVPKGQVIIPKKERKPKHKKSPSLEESMIGFTQFVVEESKESPHAYAARKHDEAAEHAAGESKVIDRPYKDACDASNRCHHAGIDKFIRSNASSRQDSHIPHSGGRVKFHKTLAQMHRDVDKE